MLVLSGLKAAHSYRVWVAGFTRAGTGPQSSKFSVTTGKLNRSTTNLIDHRQFFCQNLPLRESRVAIRVGPRIKKFKGAMSHTAHVRDEALHFENVRQLFQVLRVIQYQQLILIYRSYPLTVRIVIR